MGIPKIDADKLAPKNDMKWTNSFGNWSNIAEIGLGAMNTYTAFDAGETAKKNLAMQEEQMRKNWAATRASAQVGIERKLERGQIRDGATSQAANAYARDNSNAELNRYGIA